MTTFQALAATKTPPYLTCEQQCTPMAQAFADAVRYDRQAAAMTAARDVTLARIYETVHDAGDRSTA